MSIRFLLSPIAILIILFTLSMKSTAAPAIDGVAGDVAHGGQLTIRGSGFGQKSPAKPYLWAPFDGSANPSPLGIITSWSRVENMAYAAGEGVAGSGALMATNGSGIWTAGVLSSGFAWNDYGQKMYLFRKVKRNFEITNDLNWKAFRVWAEGLQLPDWYIQTGNGNLAVEGVGSSGWPYSSGIVSPIRGGDIQAARGSANVWRTDEILTKSNTAADQENAEFYHYVNGDLVGVMPYTSYEYRTLKFRNSDSGDMRLIFPVHGVKANTTFPSHYRYWVDDVYLDTTWARVMVGNAPTLNGSTHLEVQIPYEWSSTGIAVTVNIRSFPQNEPRYLFVVDAQGNASAGYPLDGSAPQAPGAVRLQPGN